MQCPKYFPTLDINQRCKDFKLKLYLSEQPSGMSSVVNLREKILA